MTTACSYCLQLNKPRAAAPTPAQRSPMSNGENRTERKLQVAPRTNTEKAQFKPPAQFYPPPLIQRRLQNKMRRVRYSKWMYFILELYISNLTCLE